MNFIIFLSLYLLVFFVLHMLTHEFGHSAVAHYYGCNRTIYFPWFFDRPRRNFFGADVYFIQFKKYWEESKTMGYMMHSKILPAKQRRAAYAGGTIGGMIFGFIYSALGTLLAACFFDKWMCIIILGAGLAFTLALHVLEVLVIPCCKKHKEILADIENELNSDSETVNFHVEDRIALCVFTRKQYWEMYQKAYEQKRLSESAPDQKVEKMIEEEFGKRNHPKNW